MSYGIEILGGIGNLQISSDRSMSAFKVVSSGSGSTITGISGANPDKLVAISYVPASGQFKNIAVNKNTTPWSTVDEDGTAVAVDWVVLDLFSDTTASTSGYGIQVFNSSGQLAFDSQLIGNNGVTFKEFALPSTFSGNPFEDSGPLTTNINEYVTVNHSIFVSSNFVGYRFANNTTEAPGISHLSFFEINIYNSTILSYLTNLSDLFAVNIGSV